MRALLACPPLALAAFAFSTAALLGELLLAAVARGPAAEPAIALVFWMLLSSVFGAYWLLGSLRLAGIVGPSAGRRGSVGALATAGLGAILAPLELGHPAADAIAVALSAACFATFFLLRFAPRPSPVGPQKR